MVLCVFSGALPCIYSANPLSAIFTVPNGYLNVTVLKSCVASIPLPPVISLLLITRIIKYEKYQKMEMSQLYVDLLLDMKMELVLNLTNHLECVLTKKEILLFVTVLIIKYE